MLLLACQVLTGGAAAVVLAFTARAMTHILGTGTVSERLHAALPALIVVTTAAALGRISGALSSYADGRITPLLTTEADIALVTAVCRVESSAYGEDGFADRQEAAEIGVTRTRLMVQDAQRFMSALIRMIAASGVVTTLHPLLLPLLLLAVLPAGAGAVLSARVDYETHYLNLGDRNVRSMMRWWATYSRFGDEVRANGMTGYLTYWYRPVRPDRPAHPDRCPAHHPRHQRPGRDLPAVHLGHARLAGRRRPHRPARRGHRRGRRPDHTGRALPVRHPRRRDVPHLALPRRHAGLPRHGE